jgi:hypothetical protein
VSTTPKLGLSAVTRDSWRVPYATMADYGRFAAESMEHAGADDTEFKVGEDGSVEVYVHGVVAARGQFSPVCAGCRKTYAECQGAC